MRENTIDIIKAFGIILMVNGHAGVPIVRWIYLFHMALFFLVTGYCMKDKYSNTKEDLILFIKRKIKSLYVPCVMFNVFLTLFHNVFVKIYILNENLYNIKQLGLEILKCILFSGGNQLGGAMWFLRTMCISLLIYMLLEYILKKVCFKHYEMIKFIIFFILLICSWKIGLKISRNQYFNIFTVLILYQIGHVIKKYNFKIKNIYGCFVLSMCILIILTKMRVVINLNNNKIYNPVVFIVASISGYIFCYSFSKIIEKYQHLALILQYIGQNTLPIMMLHFLAFKIVTLIQIILEHTNLKNLTSYPCYIISNGWWILYTIVGISVPLMINYIYRNIKKKCSAKCIS